MVKGNFIYVILTIDFLCIFLTIGMIFLLEHRFKQYIELFDYENIEVKDFTIRLYKLPFDHEYGGKDLVLQA